MNDSIPNQETPMTEQQAIERDFDYRSMKERTRWIITAVVFLGFVAALCATMANAQTAPTFACTNTTGASPLATTCTWSVPGATSCTAGGTTGWNGTLPPSGSRGLSGITVDMTLTLACTGPGKATLQWTPPTTNTDGSSLTNLAGYTILYGVSPTALVSTVAVNSASVTTHTIDTLAAGNWSFAVRAKTSGGAESANSNVASKAIAGFSYAGSVAIDVTSLPSAPTNVVVTEVTAFAVDENADGTLVASRVELVPLSTTCAGENCTVLTRRQ